MRTPKRERTMVSLSERNRPHTLADLIGQPRAVAQLRGIVRLRRSGAVLISGPSGCGKTSAAVALANELGCHRPGERPEKGNAANWDYIRGTDADVERIRYLEQSFRYCYKAWRMVLIDEAQDMTPKAKAALLTLLENAPRRVMVVLTTTEPDSFNTPFLRRVAHVRMSTVPADAMRDWLVTVAITAGMVNRGGALTPDAHDAIGDVMHCGRPGVALAELELAVLAYHGERADPDALSDAAGC